MNTCINSESVPFRVISSGIVSVVTSTGDMVMQYASTVILDGSNSTAIDVGPITNSRSSACGGDTEIKA